jgi:hypothetical protein
MKRTILATFAIVALGTAAMAQTSQTPAVAPAAPNAQAQVPGANSFTEAQAKERIEDAGFTTVSGLKKDNQGIWVGKAAKDGTTVDVMLDYQGNVTSK